MWSADMYDAKSRFSLLKPEQEEYPENPPDLLGTMGFTFLN